MRTCTVRADLKCDHTRPERSKAQAQARKGTDTDKETHARQARQAKEISVINSYAMSAGPLGPVSVLQ